ncbi:host-nuclease inhibitor protein Gam [Escherichia coli]|uniref:Host-nuclease inhibitor protein Gam n=1 Tax=Escherichia coli TaxID=562 RepID=A0A8S7E0M7_ECOLX|nr:host-nuclease inhibitor protein Gam [Escherichia coli]EAA2356324.1 host-nuclease inhibitor protein Gam [Escherichia coli]EEW3708085.1 host-nuclease inhibitor protein Gam [Escherichia coli]EFB2195030.1 host-nuclease inhibitor protein Gam [Escherichia coli]EFB2357841.1 host-nuclease inhibitor protein Gam [Escherichia coli]
MDINTETEIKQKHSLTPFPVFLISLAFLGRYFHSHFKEFIHERLLHSGSS